MKKEIILYGGGNRLQYAIKKYGKENIRYICDSYLKCSMLYDIEVIDFERLKEVHQDFEVIIDVDNIRIIREIANSLDAENIPYRVMLFDDSIMHVYGKYPDITYESDPRAEAYGRAISTQRMLEDMFQKYANDNLEVDFYVYVQDYARVAEDIRIYLGVDQIYAYYTVYALEKSVIPIPDYSFYNRFEIETEEYYFESFEKCIEIGNIPYEDERAFWAGNLYTDPSRFMLKKIAEDNEAYIKCHAIVVQDGVQLGRIDMLDYPKYKYLIDIRGLGWTDRVKHLLAMKRPLLLVDRPYKEFYFDKLVPMENYVPIKEDMSDLVEKIKLLNKSDALYASIVNSAEEVVKENFTKDAILKTMWNILKENSDVK